MWIGLGNIMSIEKSEDEKVGIKWNQYSYCKTFLVHEANIFDRIFVQGSYDTFSFFFIRQFVE